MMIYNKYIKDHKFYYYYFINLNYFNQYLITIQDQFFQIQNI